MIAKNTLMADVQWESRVSCVTMTTRLEVSDVRCPSKSLCLLLICLTVLSEQASFHTALVSKLSDYQPMGTDGLDFYFA